MMSRFDDTPHIDNSYWQRFKNWSKKQSQARSSRWMVSLLSGAVTGTAFFAFLKTTLPADLAYLVINYLISITSFALVTQNTASYMSASKHSEETFQKFKNHSQIHERKIHKLENKIHSLRQRTQARMMSLESIAHYFVERIEDEQIKNEFQQGLRHSPWMEDFDGDSDEELQSILIPPESPKTNNSCAEPFYKCFHQLNFFRRKSNPQTTELTEMFIMSNSPADIFEEQENATLSI